MVDMFTIIIVFLLKSYSTSSVNITPQKGLTLPSSSSYVDPVEGLKLVVSKEGVFVDDEKVATFNDGTVPTQEMDDSDPDFLINLFKALDKKVEASKLIAQENKDYKFEGKIVMQADSRLSYSVLKKVMYTASMAGYADMKLATLAYE